MHLYVRENLWAYYNLVSSYTSLKLENLSNVVVDNQSFSMGSIGIFRE